MGDTDSEGGFIPLPLPPRPSTAISGLLYTQEDLSLSRFRLDKAIFIFGFVVGVGSTLVGLLVVGLALAILGAL